MTTVKQQKKEREKSDIDFIGDVLTHYTKFGRHDLVWRKSITAYRILVSEVMLQQTQVVRVIPKFKVWMKQFPTLASLRVSTLRDVLILWQGLGYQRRAKALILIAKECKTLPKTFVELTTLPGIGTYTASAVCAFAHNQFSHPVLETNIRTVLIEYFHQGEESIHDGVLYDDLSRLEKNREVQAAGAREWYYALMDFGAHLKTKKISHNTKSVHHTLQTSYKGSFRELRARVLFSVTHNTPLPKDLRLHEVIEQLTKENYIVRTGKKYSLQDF